MKKRKAIRNKLQFVLYLAEREICNVKSLVPGSKQDGSTQSQPARRHNVSFHVTFLLPTLKLPVFSPLLLPKKAFKSLVPGKFISLLRWLSEPLRDLLLPL